MAAPAGPCEWCGGPQQWTFIAGEMYVRCVTGCLPLELGGLVPPSDSEDSDLTGRSREGLEPIRGEGVGPCEGRDSAGQVETEQRPIEEPPAGWLSTLWEGGPDGSA